jgi:hypothetical protein
MVTLRDFSGLLFSGVVIISEDEFFDPRIYGGQEKDFPPIPIDFQRRSSDWVV